MSAGSGVSVDSGVLDKLSAVLDELGVVDPSALGDGESVMGLHRQLERLAAMTTRATAAFDASQSWGTDGARACSAWLATRCRMPVPTAQRRVRLGRALRHLGVAEAAWLAGDIGEAQVGLLARARTPGAAEAMDRDEQMLVGQARRLRFGSLVKVVGYWSLHADPDGAEDQARDHHGRRRFHLSQSWGGIWFADGVFDPVNGAIVANQLKRIEDELFDADWAQARTRLGGEPTVADLARTPAQRRADAVVEMARRAGAAPPDGRRPEPLFSVLVGYESFAGMICELANGTVVSPGSLRPWLDGAWVERVVFDGPSRVIDVGVARRLFTGATRRAVQLRDHECFHPFCDVASSDCEVDHVQPWSAGGATTQANGRPACGFHNRARHRRT
jgi:hypothetical protein